MKKLKVATIVGTRPEIIRLSRVIVKLDQAESIQHSLIHTGQNYDYELNQIFFEDLELRKPDVFLNAAGETVMETIGTILIKIDSVLEGLQPDAVLILGDTNSCLCALPAKRRKIPVFHMEAGNRCFDQRVPEEINRRIVDHISDINLPYSDIAREYLLREDIPSDRVIKTGSPMFEVLMNFKEKILASPMLENLGLKQYEYFVVSSHREENISTERFSDFVRMLTTLAEEYKLPVIVSTHPRTRKMIEAKGITFPEQVRLLKPLGFCDYNKLQVHSRAVLSDSGTISEEASILNFPALNLREAHERPEAMEEMPLVMVGYNTERIIQALNILLSQYRGEERSFRLVSDYHMPNVSDKVVRIIISYVDYVNAVVWKKFG